MSCEPWTEDHVMSCDPVVVTGRYVVWPAGQGVVCHESSVVCVSKGKEITFHKILHVCILIEPSRE